MKPAAVVLLSAGLDSTANLWMALDQGIDVRLVLTANYGQRAAVREIERSAKIGSLFGIRHAVVDLPFVKDFGGSSLVDSSKVIPVGHDVSIDDYGQSVKTAKSVWVPNRNGILLNIAAGYAEALGAQYVVPGFNAEEAVTFPDNTPAFMKALDGSFAFSTSNQVQVTCFTKDLQKPEIAIRAKALGARFDLMWPCYLAAEKPCGQCESCQRDKRAFRAAGLDLQALFQDAT